MKKKISTGLPSIQNMLITKRSTPLNFDLALIGEDGLVFGTFNKRFSDIEFSLNADNEKIP